MWGNKEKRKQDKGGNKLFYFLLLKPGVVTGEGRVWDYNAVAAECKREGVYNEQI